MPSNFEADLAAIDRIQAVPTILEVVCRTTGMGFAAVARVTEERWIACAVRDDIEFGLQPGGELKLETTICHEIRQAGHGRRGARLGEQGRCENSDASRVGDEGQYAGEELGAPAQPDEADTGGNARRTPGRAGHER